MNIKSTFIRPDQKISDSLKNLTKSQCRICIVVDKNNNFKGVLNDGDIRRALLEGKSLETKINKIYNKKAITLKKNYNKEFALKKLTDQGIDQAPIVDKKKVIGIFFKNKFLYHKLETPIVIMSGGLGIRLKPITNKLPKALILIKKEPMLSLVIKNIKNYGFGNFILCTYYKNKMIKNYYKNGEILDVSIKYVNEKKPLGTAGGLSLLRNKLVEENFLLTNCDVLSQINYKNLLEFHIKNKADLTVATRKHVSQSQYGEINLKGMAIKNIIEKPNKHLIINSGIYIVKKKCLKFLKYNYQTDMNEFIIKLIKKNKKVIAYPFYESWFDLGTKEQLKISKNYV
jgi:dTDP-glucose pyrophosphorylase/predicted transcriptional regulator